MRPNVDAWQIDGTSAASQPARTYTRPVVGQCGEGAVGVAGPLVAGSTAGRPTVVAGLLMPKVAAPVDRP
jgi:hypothetical protein